MFDSPADKIVWLVQVKYDYDRAWHNYIHLATRRQAREMARDARGRDDLRQPRLWRSVRVVRVVAHGGW